MENVSLPKINMKSSIKNKVKAEFPPKCLYSSLLFYSSKLPIQFYLLGLKQASEIWNFTMNDCSILLKLEWSE